MAPPSSRTLAMPSAVGRDRPVATISSVLVSSPASRSATRHDSSLLRRAVSDSVMPVHLLHPRHRPPGPTRLRSHNYEGAFSTHAREGRGTGRGAVGGGSLPT